MEKRIVFTNPDGSIGVVIPAKNTTKTLQEIAAGAVPAGASFEIVDAETIPADRSYRNAWKFEAGLVKHDMSKAKELHKEKLRKLRGPKLEELDIEYQKADEADDKQKKKEIAAKKKALRDVTAAPEIAEAKSIEELKAIGLPEVV